MRDLFFHWNTDATEDTEDRYGKVSHPWKMRSGIELDGPHPLLKHQ